MRNRSASVGLAVVFVATMVSGCGASSSLDRSEPNPASGTSETEGTLIHSERIGSVTVEFWKTEAGAASIVTGSIDQDAELSKAITAALDRPSVSEAYLALPGMKGLNEAPATLRDLQVELELKQAGTQPTELERVEFDARMARLDAERQIDGDKAALDRAPVRALEPEGSELLALPAGWDWNSDYQWFRDTFCYDAQDCRTGYTWVYSGTKSHLTYHRITGLNNSFDGTASVGTRWARWENGAWVWRVDTNRTLSPRQYLVMTRYGGAGLIVREGWVSGYQVTNLTAAAPTFTSTPLGTDPRTSFAQTWSPLQMKGYSTTKFGSYYDNRCAHDVVGAYNNLSPYPTGRIKYRSGGGKVFPPTTTTLEPFTLWDTVTDHIQGLGRLSGVGDNRWMVVSRSAPTIAGVFLVNLGDVAGSDGSAWGNATNTPGAARATKYFYPMTGTTHPGGLQTFGKNAAVAVTPTAGKGWIEFYDFSTPGSSTAAIHRFYVNGDQGENPAPGGSLSGVAVARLHDARYLMFVLGKDSNQIGWFYVSDTTSIVANTRWFYIGSAKIAPAQSVQLITECETNDLYLLATNNARYSWPDTNRYGNYSYLRKVGYSNYTATLTKANDVDLPFNSGDGDYCTFRAGASSYVDPSGKLLMICHTRHAELGPNPEELKVAEFTPVF